MRLNRILLLLLLLLAGKCFAQTAPSFSVSVPNIAISTIQLQYAGVPNGYTVGFGVGGFGSGCTPCTQPSHGTIINLDAATGVVVYQPTSGYLGPDSFTYIIYAYPPSGPPTTSAQGTVTINVTNAKTRVVDKLLNPNDTPRQGKVSFFLTQSAGSAGGLVPVTSSVTADLDAQGQFDVQLYPSASLSPESYYQVWFADSRTVRTELIGVYNIPASSSVVTLQPYKVTDAARAARFTFADKASVLALQASVVSASAQPIAVLNSYAASNFPVAGTAGKLIRQSDGAKGVFLDNGTFFYDLMFGRVNPESLGCKGDVVLDDNGAFVSGTDNGACFGALNTLVNSQATTGTGIHIAFPAKRFYSTTGLSFTRRVTITGAGAGMWGGQAWGATELWFSDTTHGITLRQPADQSKIADIVLKSRNGGTSASAYNGIDIGAHGTILDNIGVQGFGNDNVHIDSTNGNCNNWQARAVTSRYAYRHGLYINGGDTQAGAVYGGDFSVNGKYGVYNDTASASAALYSPHAEHNGNRWGTGHPNEGKTDYYSNAATASFYNPYSDGSNWLVLGANAANYIIWSPYNGSPAVKYSTDGGTTVGAYSHNATNWVYQNGGLFGNLILYGQTGVGGAGRRLNIQSSGGDILFTGEVNNYNGGAAGTEKPFLQFTDLWGAVTRNTDHTISLFADLNPGPAKVLDIGSSQAPFSEAYVSKFVAVRNGSTSGLLELYGGTGGNLFISVDASLSGGTLKLPNLAGADYLVANDVAATLKNKTISGSLNTITGLVESALSLSDVTTGNASTSAHGFVPKLPNDASKFYDGTGNYTAPVLAGTTASVGGSALSAGACASTTLAVTGATTGMAAVASPVTDPGDGFYVRAYVSSAGNVTVKVCAAAAGTPTASTYNVRVIR